MYDILHVRTQTQQFTALWHSGSDMSEFTQQRNESEQQRFNTKTKTKHIKNWKLSEKRNLREKREERIHLSIVHCSY